MSKFTPEEITYLQSQRYGKLATVSQAGELHGRRAEYWVKTAHELRNEEQVQVK